MPSSPLCEVRPNPKIRRDFYIVTSISSRCFFRERCQSRINLHSGKLGEVVVKSSSGAETGNTARRGFRFAGRVGLALGITPPAVPCLARMDTKSRSGCPRVELRNLYLLQWSKRWRNFKFVPVTRYCCLSNQYAYRMGLQKVFNQTTRGLIGESANGHGFENTRRQRQEIIVSFQG